MPRSIVLRWLLLSAAVGCVPAWCWLAHAQRAQALPFLQPAEEIGEDDDFAQRRAEWIEHLHGHAPGTDWRAQDAATRERLHEQRAARLEDARRGALSAMPAGAPAGTWWERGARNVAGRVSDADYDVASDRLTAFAHGGQLWRAARAALDWQPLNDARRFEPTGNAQHFLRVAGGVERWIAADDTQRAMYYSDDQGATWRAAGGYKPTWTFASYVAARDVGSNQVYALIYSLNSTTQSFEDQLIVSSDRGATYANLGFVGGYAGVGHPQQDQAALFALGQNSNVVYLLVSNAFVRIEPNGTATHVSTIADAPARFGAVALSGGIDTATGTPFFYAFFEPPTGGAAVLRSLDGGATWQARGTVPSSHYIRVAAGTALHDPDQVFYGGINLYRSGDGGLSFAAVNDWSDYYGDPATKLHADISFVKTFAGADGRDVELVGTDGGLYESRDGLLTVTNLSLDGMRQAQYYGSYTGRTAPFAVSIGSQDQGYQFSAAPDNGISAFTQVISGDYGSLTSSDGGMTVWMNYPNFTLINSAANTPNPQLSLWDRQVTGFTGTYFLAPLQADPDDPQTAWIGGGSADPGHNHAVRLVRDPATLMVTATEGSFEFDSAVEALAVTTHAAITPQTWYAMSLSQSGGTNFYRSTTPLSDWMVDTNFATNFIGSMILPDPVRADTIYVCGSGYDGPSVFVSTDDGNTFAPMSDGLPSTLVSALAISPDGKDLFAATDVGPFYFDRDAAAWVDLGAGAPDSNYSHVDYVPALHVARFSTFGRGLWDFDLGGDGDLIFRDGFE